MKLISWNVNGLRACISKGFYDFVKAVDADVICVQETKMYQGQAEVDLPGYEQFWNSAEKKGYSGTAIFTRIKPLAVTYDIGLPEHSHEGRVITAEFADFYLVNVYTPNAQGAVSYTHLDVYKRQRIKGAPSFRKVVMTNSPVSPTGSTLPVSGSMISK